jgi:hypothetical protein
MTARYTAPTPTRGNAPSHSPPDTLYVPGNKLARGLGWFSIGLGLTELLAPGLVRRLTGVRDEGLLQAYGLRELACGIGILASARPTGWMWARVAGDALDLATLGVDSSDGRSGSSPGMAALAVAGVTALDVLCASALSAAEALEG